MKQPAVELPEALGIAGEQLELRREVRRVAETASYLSGGAGDGDVEGRGRVAREIWPVLREMGLLGVIVPARCGGAGLSLVELVVVLEELSRGLIDTTYGATMLAATALLSADGEEPSNQLAAIAAGKLTATVALAESQAGWDLEAMACVAVDDPDGSARLTGCKRYVVDGEGAELFLVLARSVAGLALYAVNRTAPGVRIVPLPSLDLTRPLAHLELSETAGRRIGTPGEPGAEVVARIFDHAAIFAAATQVGVASKALELSVAFAQQRVQFGRPIGAFQAIKHRLADMLLELEYARAAMAYAAWCASSDAPDRPVAAAIVKSTCSEMAVALTRRAIQIHGGIGFTWEHPAHLLLKRATADRELFGAPAYHLGRLAALLEL